MSGLLPKVPSVVDSALHMERDLLIDFGESSNRTVKDAEIGFLGTMDVLQTSGKDASSSSLVTNSSNEGRTWCSPSGPGLPALSPFGSSNLNVKVKSVDSLSVAGLSNPCIPSSLECQMKAWSPASMNLVDFAKTDSLALLSPFVTPKSKNARSLSSQCLLDAEPSKLLSPFGCPSSWGNQVAENEIIQVKDVPVGNLLQVPEQEPKLPDDLFDVEVLERQQSEHTRVKDNTAPPHSIKTLLPSIPSIGSGERSSDGTFNKAFMESTFDGDTLFPTPDDSVFGEAQALSIEFQKMAEGDPRSTLDSIEDEDEGILYECPEWKEEGAEKDDTYRSKQCKSNEGLVQSYTKEKSFEKKGVSTLPNSTSASSEIVQMVPESEDRNASFSSSISPISPLPLCTSRVKFMKLKAGKLLGAHLSLGPIKLRSSSCPSATSSKTGPLKAFLPVEEMSKSQVVTPIASGIVEKSVETPDLKVMDLSPCEGKGKGVGRRMSSTPKPSTPETTKPSTPNNNVNKVNRASSLRKQLTSKLLKNDKQGLSSSAKAVTAAKVNSPHMRSVSFGKSPECAKVGAGPSKTSAHQSPASMKVNYGLSASTHLGSSTRRSSPLPRKRVSNSPSTMKISSRSISTGNLANAPSMKKNNSTPQLSSLQSHGRSSSLSSKLPLGNSSRPLTEACVNSSESPLLKLVSKFRSSGSKGMKENVTPK